MTPAGGLAAARLPIVRLLALLAVLTGLALGNGMQCRDCVLMHLSHPGDALTAIAPAGGHDVAGAATATVVKALTAPKHNHHSTVALGACWALIAVVLSFAVLLGLRRLGIPLAAPSTGPPPRTPHRRPWLGLAQLCVLRT